MQKSDKDDAELFSKNYGFTFGAFLRGAWGFGKRFQLIGEAGYRVLPKVEHDGGTQEFDNGGPFVEPRCQPCLSREKDHIIGAVNFR